MSNGEKAALDDAAVKAALRHIGKGRQDSASLAKVLDGLSFSLRGDKLAIVFPHSLFAGFYEQNWRETVEKLAREAFGRDIAVIYSSETSKTAGPRQTRTEKKDPFDAFLGHDRNALAIAAAKEACLPKSGIKLLVFCGQPGCGKTTLLKAMRSAMLTAFGIEGVYMDTAPAFQPELAPARFWQRRKALLLDDCQQPANTDIAGYLDGACACPDARTVMAFSGKAKNMPDFDKRLASRIKAGLILELTPPDIYTRLTYIERHSPGISRQLALALARQAQDIPTLAGLLQKAEFYARITGQPLAPEVLEKLAYPDSQQVGWQRIVSHVAEKTRQKPADIIGPGRRHDLALARMAAMYLCRRRLGLSYPEIGRLFGGRNHATVIYGIKKILELRQVDRVAHTLLTELESEGQF